MRLMAIAVVFFCSQLLAFSAIAQKAPAPLRVSVVAGGGFFETSFFDMFGPYENFDTTLFPSDVAAFASDIRTRADVVVLINRSATLAEPARTNLRNFVESGGGLVIVNQALASYSDWPWWYSEVTGGRYLSQPDGATPSSGFRLNEALIVSPVEAHPIVRRLEGLPFHILDEAYKNVWMSQQNHVLLRTRNSSSDGPLLWIGPHPKARVVVHMLGYGHGAHLNLAFRHLLEDSVLWAAHRLQ